MDESAIQFDLDLLQGDLERVLEELEATQRVLSQAGALLQERLRLLRFLKTEAPVVLLSEYSSVVLATSMAQKAVIEHAARSTDLSLEIARLKSEIKEKEKALQGVNGGLHSSRHPKLAKILEFPNADKHEADPEAD